jgi:hypothetical protein
MRVSGKTSPPQYAFISCKPYLTENDNKGARPTQFFPSYLRRILSGIDKWASLKITSHWVSRYFKLIQRNETCHCSGLGWCSEFRIRHEYASVFVSFFTAVIYYSFPLTSQPRPKVTHTKKSYRFISREQPSAFRDILRAFRCNIHNFIVLLHWNKYLLSSLVERSYNFVLRIINVPV